VAELEGTANFNLAKKHGFKPTTAALAASKADMIQILAPDQTQAALYKNEIKDKLTGLGLSLGMKFEPDLLEMPVKEIPENNN